MNKRIADTIPLIIHRLQNMKVEETHAFLGFDACIDNIVRIVKNKKANKDVAFFTSSKQFGEFLISLDNRSCSIELRTQRSKPGGNMVITANALGNLGLKVDCAGTFGLPHISPVFGSISPNCTLHTIENVITTTLLEFNDSKLMMFDPGPYATLDWNVIKDRLGKEKIKELILSKKLVAFLNWSEIENSSIIWEGILTEILSTITHPVELPYFLTDFSDCSRRSKKDILHSIELLSKFRKFFKVIISLNENEAEVIAKALELVGNNSEEEFIKTLFSALQPDELAVHRTNDALGYNGLNFEKCDTFYCQEPKILTGGGDNFNAGYCFARLNGFDLFESLIIANAVSGYYVRFGNSPGIEGIIEILKE
jgi:uncharacterized ferredoxin-like protein